MSEIDNPQPSIVAEAAVATYGIREYQRKINAPHS
jgi:hypothetical protein